jgi:hypothetical protein
VRALRRKIRKDAGTRRAVSSVLVAALAAQHKVHPTWSYQLHADNLVALAELDAALGHVPSDTTIRQSRARRCRPRAWWESVRCRWFTTEADGAVRQARNVRVDTSGTRRDELWRMRACAALRLATACTHHHPVTTLRPTSLSTEATAQLVDDREVKLRVATTPDGLRWVQRTATPDDGGAGPPGANVDSSEMRSFTTVSHGRGALEGLVLGGASGFALGIGIGLASGDDHCNPSSLCLFQLSAGEKALIVGVALGTTGLALGALVGAVIGSHDAYELSSGFVPRVSTTIGPSRAGGGLSWSF